MEHQINQLPKVELHSHLEGTMSPALVRQIAQRNGIQLKDDLFTDQDTFAWNDFLSFLRAFDEASRCLLNSNDYRDIMYEYLRICAEDGAIYAETFISPDHASELGMSYNDVQVGCIQGIEDAQRDFDIIGRVIVTCVRHLGPQRAIIVAQQMVNNPHPYFVGFGMGGSETAHTMADFSPAYQIAADAGYPCTVHAGEICGPESVWDAINHLPISRIGHGVRCVEDEKLMRVLVQRSIALEICPSSNLALSIYSDWPSHPLKQILEAGISISLNSDDPPFFCTSVGQEYQYSALHFNLQVEQLQEISRMAIRSSFADNLTKKRLISLIDQHNYS
jgi:adenosine deaminase